MFASQLHSSSLHNIGLLRSVPWADRQGPAVDRDRAAESRRRPNQGPVLALSDANRAAAAGIETKLGNHSFRATGITAYLKNGGTLEKAAAMANHASTRTTQLDDRRRYELSLDEVERIGI